MGQEQPQFPKVVSFFWCIYRICEKQLLSLLCLFVFCLHGATQLPVDGFSWNFVLEAFSKICHENSSLQSNYQLPSTPLFIKFMRHSYIQSELKTMLKALTLRRLMSYIYIWSTHSLFSRSHTTTQHSR